MAPDNDKIYRKLEQMDSRIVVVLRHQAAIDERCIAHKELTTEVRKTLYGNPDGLTKQVQKLVNCKTNINEEKAEEEKRSERWKKFWLFILQSVVVWFIIGATIFFLKVFKAIQF